MSGKRAYCKNTVPGTHPGKKWDAQTRAEVLSDYLLNPKLCGNICAVAQKHGVPESTIRGWLKNKSAKSQYEQAMDAAARDIALTATAAARNTVEYMRKVSESEERMDAAGAKSVAQWADVLSRIGSAGRREDPEGREDTGGGVIQLGERPEEEPQVQEVLVDGS